MNATDPILLVTYLLFIAYFLYRMVQAFNDEYSVRVDQAMLKHQLEAHKLQDIVNIGFGFAGKYEFNKLKQFSVSITNKSPNMPIYVDWDYCTMTDFSGRSRRVTRLVPGRTIDLSQEQVFSTIAPNTTLKEFITAEDVLKRGEGAKDKSAPVALEIEVAQPLVDPSKVDAKRKTRFMRGKQHLEFFLELALRHPDSPWDAERSRILCKFMLTKLPWTAGLPWAP